MYKQNLSSVLHGLRFVRMPPHVDQTHRRMKTVKHNQGFRDVVQNVPKNVTVEFIAENQN